MSDVVLEGRPQVSEERRQQLRTDFGEDFIRLCGKGKFTNTQAIADRCGLRPSTIRALQTGRKAEEQVTVRALHKLAQAPAFTKEGEEINCGATTSLESLWSVGIRVAFLTEGV